MPIACEPEGQFRVTFCPSLRSTDGIYRASVNPGSQGQKSAGKGTFPNPSLARPQFVVPGYPAHAREAPSSRIDHELEILHRFAHVATKDQPIRREQPSLSRSSKYGFAIHADLLPADSLHHAHADMEIRDSAF